MKFASADDGVRGGVTVFCEISAGFEEYTFLYLFLILSTFRAD